MEQDTKVTNDIVEKTYTDPVTGKFIVGNPGGGRPKGSNNFETDFDEAVDEIAKENKMTRSEARKLLLKVAFKQAKDGNYSFYKDIHDRIYGQAASKTDITTMGRPIIQIAQEVLNKNEINPEPINNSQG